MLPSPYSRKREHDEDISGREAMLRRRKLPSTTATFVQPSSSLKIAWSKDAEISILSGILEFQKETGSSYNKNWDDFYSFMRESMTMRSDFSKQQLMDKVKKLKKRFRDNQLARANDGIRLSFTNTDDEELFRLSKIIWVEKETEWVYEENKNQTKQWNWNDLLMLFDYNDQCILKTSFIA
ncbi:PREDICTED: GLABROUS1 enhancer-binding protein-like 3 [Camelina sativa]|uniref:GLABROUS1 enhancer-binding protein-like 3 n=1 Tax=Camelina sativa TaxID=90675 RepID=A0ABM1QL90_CAMSA|nr:PREDICTED: GLABROUS1 enhancer-binding protein-like 3 [Camelina sativa]